LQLCSEAPGAARHEPSKMGKQQIVLNARQRKTGVDRERREIKRIRGSLVSAVEEAGRGSYLKVVIQTYQKGRAWGGDKKGPPKPGEDLSG